MKQRNSLIKTAPGADILDGFLDQMAKQMPERRLTSVQDVADVVAFRMTERADPLYGTAIRVSRAAIK